MLPTMTTTKLPVAAALHPLLLFLFLLLLLLAPPLPVGVEAVAFGSDPARTTAFNDKFVRSAVTRAREMHAARGTEPVVVQVGAHTGFEENDPVWEPLLRLLGVRIHASTRSSRSRST